MKTTQIKLNFTGSKQEILSTAFLNWWKATGQGLFKGWATNPKFFDIKEVEIATNHLEIEVREGEE